MYVFNYAYWHLMFLCHLKSKCDRLMLSTEELESKLCEMAARNGELEEQWDEEAENSRLLKVPSSFVVLFTFSSIALPPGSG